MSIDFAGFSGETLTNTLSEALDKVRAGRLTPSSIELRMLVTDTTRPLAFPRRIDTQGEDDPAIRRRSDRINRRSLDALIDAVTELGDLGFVESASAQVRVHELAPTMKLYILNSQEVFFGFYPVIEHTVTVNGEAVPIYDVMGKDATLFHFSINDDDTSDARSMSNSRASGSTRSGLPSVANTIAMTSISRPEDLYRAALRSGDELSGFYNKNVPVKTQSGLVLVRIPLTTGPSMDLRIWPEADILRAANEYVDAVPRLLFASDDPRYQIHEFVDGQLLDLVAPRGVAVPPSVVPAVAKLFGQLAQVSAEHLPQLPNDWPDDGDTSGFLGVLVGATREVWNRCSQHQRYRQIYDAFGFPADPLEPLIDIAPKCTQRPFHLLHSDVHRKNTMLVGDSVIFLDWELALWGDPVYDMAVHLHKMDYKSQEEGALLRTWRAIMPEALVNGWENDLPVYRRHEQLKSAVVDTVRYSDLIRSNKLSSRERDARISQLANKLNRALAIWGKAPVGQEAVGAVLMEYDED